MSLIILVIFTIFQDSVTISEMEFKKTNETQVVFPMGRSHGGFRDAERQRHNFKNFKKFRKNKRCPSMYTRSLNENICLRYV